MAAVLSRVGGGRARPLVAVAGLVALAASLALLLPAADWGALGATWRAARADPAGLALALAAYLAAFWLRALLWTRVLPGLRAGQALAGIHLALAGNHVLPLRLGEALRVTSVVRRTEVAIGAATASTIALRSADLLSVVGLAALLAPGLLARLLGDAGWAVMAALAAAGLAGWLWLRRPGRGLRSLAGGSRRLPAMTVVAGAVAAWLLESVLVWQAARWAGVDLSAPDALLVTVVSVAAQVLAVAPGGFGTYEAAGVAAYALLGVAPGTALAAALAAHALKTAYALAAGAVALLVPAPTVFGRLRLARPPARAHPAPEPGRLGSGSGPARVGPGPVVLFLPAHDEAPRVAAVIARVPARVHGRPVECVVVDDGSSDGTAEAAARAGATVLRLGANRGLGAAVRRGLAWSVERGAAAVAFCDADGEYDPAELERLVGPIVEGRADYVLGSRFAGEIRRMLPHRRLGNRVLTRSLSFVARTRLSDGQSGFRALSGAAAAAAEIVHDYNYAQVLTLDLLGKGYRYHEVPISYAFRRSGRSFIRLGRYLCRVLPAVHRELNAPTRGAPDARREDTPRTVPQGGVDNAMKPIRAGRIMPPTSPSHAGVAAGGTREYFVERPDPGGYDAGHGAEAGEHVARPQDGRTGM